MQGFETETFVKALALQIAIFFLLWLSSHQVTNVLGTGPVPSYRLTIVPSGPVVNGNILSVPGPLMA